jgi:hypothetical protein
MRRPRWSPARRPRSGSRRRTCLGLRGRGGRGAVCERTNSFALDFHTPGRPPKRETQAPNRKNKAGFATYRARRWPASLPPGGAAAFSRCRVMYVIYRAPLPRATVESVRLRKRKKKHKVTADGGAGTRSERRARQTDGKRSAAAGGWRQGAGRTSSAIER